MQRRAEVDRHRPARRQAATCGLQAVEGEEGSGRAAIVGFGQVEDDQVEAPAGTAEGFHQPVRVADGDVQARVVGLAGRAQGALVDARQPFARQADDLGVQFGHHHLADRGNAQQFEGRAAVAAAHHQRAARAAVRRRHRVDHQFVLDPGVRFGAHHAAIEPEDAAKLGAFANFDLLICRT
ncbi:hypothetical protein D3C86_1702470 [compost metagenome]